MLSSSSSLSLLAYGTIRYRAPPKHYTSFLTISSFRDTHHCYHRLLLPCVSPRYATSFLRQFPYSNRLFQTGNSLLSRMERFFSGSGITKSKGMVEQLQNYGVIKSKKVAEIMATIDRALFVPDGTLAYVDSPMPIGYNATISAPHMHALCLELLEHNLQPGMHALDVGSGTGYLTACFAMMVGPQGRAVGVEHIPELVVTSTSNVEKSAAAPLLKEGALSLHVGDGRLGWPDAAPYDAIHVGAAAAEVPQPLIDQLKPGGRMVIPVGNYFQDLKVIDKNEDGSITIRSETSVRYVPLTSRESQLRNS